MFFIKRTLWMAAIAAVMVVLTPGLGFCVEEDMYIYRLLFARVYFEYETGTSDDNGNTLERSAFQQAYSFDTLGNILSRRLATYDAGVSYTLKNYEQEQTTIDSKYLNYYLKTTLLPKSNIPLTLYGSNLNETTTTTVETDRTRTILGLQWNGKFRTLPDTRLQIERQNDTSGVSDMTTTMYNLNMSKSLGPTDNFLSYNLNTTADNSNDNNDSLSQAVHLSNQTRLSRSTILDFGLSRGSGSHDNPITPEVTVNGLTIGLQSRPSIDFDQTHRYTYYNTAFDGSAVESGTYSGSMSYRFTDRLSSSLSLSSGENTTDSPDRQETSTTLGAGFGLNYKLSNKFMLAETINYSKQETSADTPTSTDRELFRALTHLTYGEQLSWVALSASTRLGYNRDKTSDESSGSGIEQGFSIGLSGIDINRYLIFNTSADWSRVYPLTGGVWSESKSFSASTHNKLWRRYVQLAAKYNRSSHASWIDATETRSQNWSLNAGSAYFRNTRIEFTSEHNSTFDVVTGDLDTDSELLNISHNRYIAGGSLNFGFSYNLISSSFEGGSTEFTSMSFFGQYEKKLMRNLNWLAAASYSTGEGDNNTFRNITAFSNVFTYPLRSWLVSAEQKYLHTEDQNRDLVDNSMIFRATRQFLWML